MAMTEEQKEERRKARDMAANKKWYEDNKEEIDAMLETMPEETRRGILKLAGYWNEENIAASNERIAKQRSKERKAASWAKRKAAKLQRTPAWNTKEDDEIMVGMFSKRTTAITITGESHHVDHVIPLQGDKVSGLHVPSNLKVISATDNTSKKNKYDVMTEWVLSEPDHTGCRTMQPK